MDSGMLGRYGDHSHCSIRRKHIDVRGIVQGVGFRPFVYTLPSLSG